MKNKKLEINQLSLFEIPETEGTRKAIKPVKKSNKPEKESNKPVTKVKYHFWDKINGITSLSDNDPRFKRRSGEIISLAKEAELEVDGLVVHDNLNNLASVDKKKNLRLQEKLQLHFLKEKIIK